MRGQRAHADGRILIHGCYHNRNFGDLLLLDLLSMAIERLTGRRPLCPWVHASERNNVHALAGAGLNSIFGGTGAVFGGGGYLTDDDSKGSSKRLLRYLVPALVWRFSGVPYGIFAVGVGPGLSAFGRLVARLICRGARRLVVRDEDSRELLVQAGVARERILVTADLVLGLAREDIPDAAWQTAEALVGPRRGARRLGLHLSLPEGSGERIREIVALVMQGLASGPDVDIYFIFDHLETNRQAIDALARDIGPRARVVGKQSHWVTAALIAQLDGVVTTKLHVGIAAWALGVAPYGVAAHGKTVRFFRQVGREDYIRPLSGDIAVLAAWMADFAAAGSGSRVTEDARREDVRRRAQSNVTELGEFLREFVQ